MCKYLAVICYTQNGGEIARRVGGASFCFKALNNDKEGTWIVNCSGPPSVTFDPNGNCCNRLKLGLVDWFGAPSFDTFDC